MSDLLSGLSSLGLGGLEGMEVFEEEKKPQASDGTPAAPQVTEKDIVYDKSYVCPLCDEKFTAKTVKAGKCKLLHTDLDLRSVYDGIDILKYDVVVCPHCGNAALTRYFKPLTSMQMKLVRENISKNFKMQLQEGDIIEYEDALKRYQLALANAIVKKAHASEKAYICLKSGWLLRGWQESLTGNTPKEQKKKAELAMQEKQYLQNAYEGFVNAVQSESFPMCGMDETTVDYLMAVLALKFEKFEVASKLIGTILTSPAASPRMKDKTRDLKDMVIEEIKKKKQEIS